MVGSRVHQSVQVRSPQIQVKTSGIRPFVDPSIKITAAKERDNIGRNERNGRSGGQVGARGSQPCTRGKQFKEIKECESFLSRATSHLEELDAKAEVQHLQGLVSQLQAQIDTLRQNRSRDNQPEGPVLKRVRRREDFVPQCRRWRSGWWGTTQISRRMASVSRGGQSVSIDDKYGR